MARTGKIISGSIKALFYLIIIIINVIVLWRVLFSGDPREIKPLIANEALKEAYLEHGDKLRLEAQELRTISSSGKFSVTDCVFIPEAKQIQVTVRYNNSTVKGLKGDFGLSEMPSREDELFDVTIVKTTDLTPDNTEDNLDRVKLSEERFYPSGEAKEAYKTLYSYRKYIFENVTYEDAVGMFVDIYYEGDKNYEETPYDALCIYDALLPTEERVLSHSDKKALEG